MKKPDHPKSFLRCQKGFSMVEFLVVFLIFILLGTGIIMIYRIFSRGVELGAAANQIINTLNLAANQSLASKDSSVHGLHFDTNSFALFRGTPYNPVDPNNEIKSLPSNLAIISVILSGGGSDVIFNRLTASTSNYGSITVSQVTSPFDSYTINVLPSGQTSLLHSVTTTDTRVTDSRHLHFDLNWSIQGASTLTLVFGDPLLPDATENITMADYFNGGQTEFDWQGTINAAGETQTLQVRTHDIGLSDTELCIHRDRRYNSKAVIVFIDGKKIVSYDADGNPTVGPFGGIMEAQ